MNFLLYMLSRASRPAAARRPTPRQMLLAGAAAHAAAGRFAAALGCYRRLGHLSDLLPLDLLIRGHLHLALGHASPAARDIALGADRLLTRRADPVVDDAAPAAAPLPTALEHLLAKADGSLRRGRYVLATDYLRRFRTVVDVLISAQAALAACTADDGAADPPAAAPLASLITLSGLGLRMLAHAQLATHLADSLRRRNLRDDLAPWAISGAAVSDLLEKEVDRLAAASRDAASAGRADVQYQLGLVAHAAGRPAEAAAAFRRTLALHPHHVPSAARLAVTDAAGAGRWTAVRQSIAVAPETLATFSAFAQAAAEAATFDRAVRQLCAGLPAPARATAEANLAFALGEVALPDVGRVGCGETVLA
jgi:hypothetical protein